MKIVALIIAAGMLLSGCNGLGRYSEALVPQLKPLEVRIATQKSCGDMVRDSMGIVGDEGPRLTADQALRLVQGCEQRDKDGTLSIDPQAARKVRHGAVNPASLLSPLP